MILYIYIFNIYIFELFAGGAWLSSIRVLMRLVKSSNECNPL